MGRSFSGSGVGVCPLCEAGEMERRGAIFRCGSCDRLIGETVLKTIEQIAALPDALGSHACECGHPEMRRLPDGVFHCPACGAEVILPDSTPSAPPGPIGLDGIGLFESTAPSPAPLVWRVGREKGI